MNTYIDCFASKPHNTFIKTNFITDLDRYDHWAQCVNISYKWQHKKSVKNTVYKHQTR